MKALVIKGNWLKLILAGEKSWEMRSRTTSVRGRIALIEAGSGQVKGVANLTDVKGPLFDSDMFANVEKHQIPASILSGVEFTKWRMAWVLKDVIPLSRPVYYSHPKGAVTWVNLDRQAVREIHRLSTPSISAHVEVPVAKDGTWFGPHLGRSGMRFTIGAKGKEYQVSGFSEALEELGKMEIARWRRPNSAGNWGIVRAHGKWKTIDELARKNPWVLRDLDEE